MADAWDKFPDAPVEGAKSDPWSAFPDAQTDASGVGAKPAQATPRAQEPSTASDVMKSAGSGLVHGVTGAMGLPGDIEELMRAGWNGVAPESLRVTGNEVGGIKPATTHDIESATGIEGNLHEPQTTAGKFARTVGEFAPLGLALGPGGLARKAITQVAAPGVASEAAGQATEGTTAEPYARAAAAMAAPAAMGVAGRVITPIPARPQAAQAAGVLAGEGVPTTAGQRTGSRILQYAENHLGDMPGAGGRARQLEEAQSEAFTRAVLRRVGEDAPRATPAVVDDAFNRIGGEFDRLSANNSFTVDRALQHNMAQAVADYNHITAPSLRAPIIQEIADDVANNLGHTVDGTTYQATRSTIGRMERATKDHQLGAALGDIREALDQAMSRSVSPADAEAWGTARRQYRNLIAVERSVTGAGADAAQGLVSPQQLRTAIVGQNRRAYARGQGDFSELARAGSSAMKPLPQSGTGPRNAIGGIATAVGSAVGAAGAGVPGAVAGTVGGAVAPGIAGRMILSRPAQAYLGNQALAAPIRAINPAAAATVNAASAVASGEPRRDGNAMAGAPSALMKLREGAIAKNPKTGARVILRDGEWVPLRA